MQSLTTGGACGTDIGTLVDECVVLEELVLCVMKLWIEAFRCEVVLLLFAAGGSCPVLCTNRHLRCTSDMSKNCPAMLTVICLPVSSSSSSLTTLIERFSDINQEDLMVLETETVACFVRVLKCRVKVGVAMRVSVTVSGSDEVRD